MDTRFATSSVETKGTGHNSSSLRWRDYATVDLQVDLLQTSTNDRCAAINAGLDRVLAKHGLAPCKATPVLPAAQLFHFITKDLTAEEVRLIGADLFFLLCTTATNTDDANMPSSGANMTDVGLSSKTSSFVGTGEASLKSPRPPSHSSPPAFPRSGRTLSVDTAASVKLGCCTEMTVSCLTECGLTPHMHTTPSCDASTQTHADDVKTVAHTALATPVTGSPPNDFSCLVSRKQSLLNDSTLRPKPQGVSRVSSTGALDAMERSMNSVASMRARRPVRITKTADIYEDDEGFSTVNEYLIQQEIGGHGANGQVYLASHIFNGTLHAVKVIKNSSLFRAAKANEDGDDYSQLPDDEAVHEVQIMKRVNHRNIVRLQEAICDPRQKKIYLVMPYMNSGCILHTRSLNDPTRYQPLPIDKLQLFLRQIVSGLAYLHNKSIAHRDIKPENILVEVSADGERRAYIADFGVSELCRTHDDAPSASEEGKPTRATAARHLPGTAYFMSPELLELGEAGLPADVWALGVTFFAMTYGELPFRGDTREEVRTAILNDTLVIAEKRKAEGDPGGEEEEEEEVPAGLRDLLGMMLTKDPKERPCIEDIRRSKAFVPLRNMQRVLLSSPSKTAEEGETTSPASNVIGLGDSPGSPMVDESTSTSASSGAVFQQLLPLEAARMMVATALNGDSFASPFMSQCCTPLLPHMGSDEE